MKNKIRLSSIFIVVSLSLSSAQLPYVESFETGTAYTPDVDVIDNLSDYFARMSTPCLGAGISPLDVCEANFNMGYTGYDGNFYWAGEDHDDTGVGGTGNSTLCITLDAIDISANTMGILNLSIAAAANDISNAYDDLNDGIFVTYSVDGAPFQAVHTWDYYTPDGGTSEFLAYDSNNDGVIGAGESDILTPEFEIKSRDINAVGNSLVIKICAHSNSSSEEWAVDNIVVSTAVTLPVELTFFDGKKVADGVALSWQTASEINNYGFEVQRSSNGTQWEVINFKKGQGNSSKTHNYEYIDALSQSGNKYYRLKQIDFNGEYQFSEIIQIEQLKENSEIYVYPNPVKHSLTINTKLEVGSINIYNYLGELVKANILPSPQIDLSDLKQGIYIIQIEVQGQLWNYRVLKL